MTAEGYKKGLETGKRWAIRAAVAGGLYWVMSPAEYALDAQTDFAPNPVQQEFMRLAAQKFDYVLLGDADHRRAEIGLFAEHPATVAALAAGGDRFFFTEHAPSKQQQIEDVRARSAPADGKAHYNWSASWVCSAEARDRYDANYESSVRANPDMNFIAADQRHNGDSDAGKAMNGWRTYLTLRLPMNAYSTVYGCLGWQAFIPYGLTALFASGSEPDLTDDRSTADFIRKTAPEGGTIFYGAGHFKDEPGVLNKLLQAEGKTTGVIDIYADFTQARRGADNRSAHMIADHGSDPSNGIRTFTREMDMLYEQAVENVRMRTVDAAPKGMAPG
jgi:hypothetical protein